jgi:hypothetical protein
VACQAYQGAFTVTKEKTKPKQSGQRKLIQVASKPVLPSAANPRLGTKSEKVIRF